jgi:hypothetical protein
MTASPLSLLPEAMEPRLVAQQIAALERASAMACVALAIVGLRIGVDWIAAPAPRQPLSTSSQRWNATAGGARTPWAGALAPQKVASGTGFIHLN